MIGESIKEMILKTSIAHLSLLRGKIDELFSAIMKTDINHSPLKSQIQNYMASIDHLVVVQFVNSTKISSEVQSECLATVASRIANDLNSKSEEVGHCQLLKTNLVTLDAKQDTLKELEQLDIQRKHLYNSILETNKNLVNKQNDISPMTLQEALKTQHDELACMVWV